MVHIGNEWGDILKQEFEQKYYLELREFLKEEYSNYKIFPEMNDIFNAFKLTSFNDVKAVIFGQDPYHGEGQAHGLCFSVKKGTAKPPSLVNIFKELSSDIGIMIPDHGELVSWAENGVLMLNSCLTVREGQANSHHNMGWEIFTDHVAEHLNRREKPIVFIMWGRNARNKSRLITNSVHLKLEAAHPSPLSAYNGFFGCKHFSKTNDFLIANGIVPIDWNNC